MKKIHKRLKTLRRKIRVSKSIVNVQTKKLKQYIHEKEALEGKLGNLTKFIP